MPVQFEKDAGGGESRAFVAVDEGMVAGDTFRIGGGEIEEVSVSIDVMIPRTGQRGFEEALITKSRPAAVFREQAGVNSEDEQRRKPDRVFHSRQALIWRVPGARFDTVS